MNTEERLARVIEMHTPKRTGRSEYKLGEGNKILSIEETYVCPTCCGSWFFKGFECDTYKAATGE